MSENAASHSSPHLHPSHLLAPKETHIAEVEHDMFTGNKLINSYEVLSEIGRGEHGKVKLGQNLENGSRVAMKIVPRFSSKRRLGKLGAPEDRVKKEVAILKKARHPNVVSLLEVIDDPNKKKVYIVLEYVERGEIRWRKKGLREIILINNRRLEFERQGRDETTETFDQDMLIMRRARMHRQRILDRARAIGQNPVPQGSPEYGEDEEDDPESPTIHREVSTTTHRSGGAGTNSDDRKSVPSERGWQDPSPRNVQLREESLANTSTISHQSSEHWEDEDDECSYVPTLTLAEAKSAFRDTLLGLEFLHFQGIIHRDIKPANLLVSSDGHVKISDFGVSYLGKPLRDDEFDNLSDKLSEKEAREMDDPRLLARTVGTPAFYAPELIYWDTDIFEGGIAPTVTGAIDLWALGVTLYCMIYGRLPFLPGDADLSLFEKIMHEGVFLPKQRLKPVDFGQDSRASSQVQMDHVVNSAKRAEHELVYEDVPESARDLIRLLLIKDPAYRMSIENAKMHPWVVEGIENPGRWIGDTDPKRHGEEKIVVSETDVSHAVVKKTVLERTIENIKGIAESLMTKARESRRRATSVATTASASVESVASTSGSSRSTVGKDKNSKLPRRASVRGDETTTAPRASRDGEHHPLARSQIASPADRNDRSYIDPDITAPGVEASSTGCSPPPDSERMSRPRGPARVLSALSTAESTKTVRAPQPKPGRSTLLESEHQEFHSPNLFETTATSIGNIFSGAGKRLSGMRSRERRPLDSSRSSSADGRFPEGTGHAEPSLALSNATASGKVVTPEALSTEVDPLQEMPRQLRPLSPQPRRISLFQPPSSSAEAFEHAQEVNQRRLKLDADIVAERAASRLGNRQPDLDCPPSPDDEIHHSQVLDDMQEAGSQILLSNQPSASTIASSDAAENGGISQSTSHPSIPSVASGASSVYPDEPSPPRKGPPSQLETKDAQSLMSTGETLIEHEKPLTMPAAGIPQNTFSNRGSSEEDEGSSEDEGLTFGRPRKRSTADKTKA